MNFLTLIIFSFYSLGERIHPLFLLSWTACRFAAGQLFFYQKELLNCR